MIECIFTIDYEIYGNGKGDLRKLVYEPSEKLMNLFQKRGLSFVAFIEAAELEMIEGNDADPDIRSVTRQIRDLYDHGIEIGLHLHPQWYNGHYENGKWALNYEEYNMCILGRERITQIVDRSIAYLRSLLSASNFVPLSFRAGNWLMQPSREAAEILSERGIKVDSSVFKGGRQRRHNLDYRKALRNGTYWRFLEDVSTPDPNGVLLELPIHTRMVPTWKMFTGKRIGFHHKSPQPVDIRGGHLDRFSNVFRFRYPLKLDFCRMTLNELTETIRWIIREDEKDPSRFWPVVAIGHTKDLVDLQTVESFLSFLSHNDIKASTFQQVYPKCSAQKISH